MRSRLLTLTFSLAVAILVGGADGCSSDPNVEGAKLDLNSGEYDRALANLDEALAANPDNVDALLLQTEVYRRQYDATAGAQPKQAYLAQNFDKMTAALRRAETLAPDDPRVRDARLNTWALAINAGNMIVRDEAADPSTAVPYLTAANELSPDSTQGYLSLGLAYLRAGQAAQAIAPLERAATINPNDPTAAYYYGRALLLSDRASEAVAVLEAAQAQFPDDTDVETMLLNAYTSSGQTDKAMERYGEAARTQPDDPTIRYNYGALLLQSGRYDEAVTELTAATRLDPANADAFYNLGAAYQNKAAEINTRANASEDNAEANALIEERNMNLEMALAPLTQARTLASGTADETGFCEALFRVYTQLNRIDEGHRGRGVRGDVDELACVAGEEPASRGSAPVTWSFPRRGRG